MKSKISKLIDAKDVHLLIDPDGNIKGKPPMDSRTLRKQVLNKMLHFDTDILDEYPYFVEDGVISVHNQDITELIMSAHYNNFVRNRGNLAEEWRRKRPNSVERDENKMLSFVSNDYAQRGGGQVIANGKVAPSIGNTFYRTAGLKYTFGIELETSAGRLTMDDLYMSNSSMEGDRTIQAYEYVSNILAGDAGLVKAERLADAISRRAAIGDENGLHIHIGGYDKYKKLWTPMFNRMFSINAIKLAAQIEDEMMALIHPKRRTQRYLKSVKPWQNIDGNNWRDVLGDFVFAGSNDIFRPEEHYETHTLDEKHNTTFNISRWAKTKHKWMNLNHCNAASHVNTIEFRLFGATGHPNRIRNFIILSMAIVWFIENKQRLIWQGGVTLQTILEHALARSPRKTALREMLQFINTRKEKFKI